MKEKTFKTLHTVCEFTRDNLGFILLWIVLLTVSSSSPPHEHGGTNGTSHRGNASFILKKPDFYQHVRQKQWRKNV